MADALKFNVIFNSASLYQDDGRVKMEGYVHWNAVYGREEFASSGTGTRLIRRPALNPRATGSPTSCNIEESQQKDLWFNVIFNNASLYQDDGRVKMEGYVHWNAVYGREEFASNRTGTRLISRPALNPRATGSPTSCNLEETQQKDRRGTISNRLLCVCVWGGGLKLLLLDLNLAVTYPTAGMRTREWCHQTQFRSNYIPQTHRYNLNEVAHG